MVLDWNKSFCRPFSPTNFTFYPIVWILCSRGLNNKINSLHERALKFVRERLTLALIQQRNLQLMATVKAYNSTTVWLKKYVTILLNQELCPKN